MMEQREEDKQNGAVQTISPYKKDQSQDAFYPQTQANHTNELRERRQKGNLA